MRRTAGCLVILGLSALTAGCAAAPATVAAAGGTVRTYFVAADEVVWDYAPTGVNQTEGRPFTALEKPWMEAGPHVAGRKAKKALYREYTDASFTTLKPRPPEWEHLGFLGPVIRGEVGDTIRIVFRNNVKFPAAMHPHGVLYDKDSEGALYQDGTGGKDKADDGVAPGGTHTYTWQVPERAGPSPHEGSSAFWMYHSHTDEVRDVASGLIGPLIITRKGMARPDGSPTDVDRELVAGFIEVDENHSWYVEDNIRTYTTDPKGTLVLLSQFADLVVMAAPSKPGAKAPPFDPQAVDPPFGAWFKETINGYSYGHTPGLRAKKGQRVRWYLMGSTNFEFHSPHWHGNVVDANHMRTDVGLLLPMGMQVADMVPDNPGKWLFHCHVSSHLKMGMQAFYTIDP